MMAEITLNGWACYQPLVGVLNPSRTKLTGPEKNEIVILGIPLKINFRSSRTNPDEPGAPDGRNGRTTAQRFERTDEPPRSGAADEPRTAVRLLPYCVEQHLRRPVYHGMHI